MPHPVYIYIKPYYSENNNVQLLRVFVMRFQFFCMHVNNISESQLYDGGDNRLTYIDVRTIQYVI